MDQVHQIIKKVEHEARAAGHGVKRAVEHAEEAVEEAVLPGKTKKVNRRAPPDAKPPYNCGIEGCKSKDKDWGTW